VYAPLREWCFYSRCLSTWTAGMSTLGELERLGAFVTIQPEDHVDLQVGDVADDQIRQLGSLPHLFHSLFPAGAHLVSQVEPRLDAVKESPKSGFLKSLQTARRAVRRLCGN
jgi:hypothetical protein